MGTGGELNLPFLQKVQGCRCGNAHDKRQKNHTVAFWHHLPCTCCPTDNYSAPQRFSRSLSSVFDNAQEVSIPNFLRKCEWSNLVNYSNSRDCFPSILCLHYRITHLRRPYKSRPHGLLNTLCKVSRYHPPQLYINRYWTTYFHQQYHLGNWSRILWPGSPSSSPLLLAALWRARIFTNINVCRVNAPSVTTFQPWGAHGQSGFMRSR